MPIYSYSCLECNTKSVKMCKIDERDLQVCDTCDTLLKRGMDRPGGVYAPTASNGGSLKV